MRLQPGALSGINAAIAAGGGPLATITDVELYSGASPWSLRPLATVAIGLRGGVPPAGELVDRLDRRFGGLGHLRERAPHNPSEMVADTVGRLAASFLERMLGIPFAGGTVLRDGRTWAWCEAIDVPLAQLALLTALAAVADAAREPGGTGALPFIQELEGLGSRAKDQMMLVVEAARRRDIPVLAFSGRYEMWQVGWGLNAQQFWSMASNKDGAVALVVSRHKNLMKALLRQLGMPTPRAYLLKPDEAPIRAAEAIGFPCVVKPLDQGQGRGVSADIRSQPKLEHAVELARRYSRAVLVERHIDGEDHRLTVIDGKLAAVTRRRPAEIIGDGRRTVVELVEALNARQAADRFLKLIPLDEGMDAALAAQGVTRDTVPEAGRAVKLRTIANFSMGGSAFDETHRVHAEVRLLAEHLARAAGIHIAGIDYITTDISKSPAETGGGFIEINCTPGLHGNLGAAGIDEVAIASLVLEERLGRIPVTLIVADVEQHEFIYRRIAQACAADRGSAVTSEDHAQIGPMILPGPHGDPFILAQAPLRYPVTRAHYIIWSAATLCHYGVPVDRLDRAILVGTALEPDWRALLERISREVCETPDPRMAAEVAVRAA